MGSRSISQGGLGFNQSDRQHHSHVISISRRVVGAAMRSVILRSRNAHAMAVIEHGVRAGDRSRQLQSVAEVSK